MHVSITPDPTPYVYGYVYSVNHRPVAKLSRSYAGDWAVYMLNEHGAIIRNAGITGTYAQCRRALSTGVYVDSCGDHSRLTWDRHRGYVVTAPNSVEERYVNLADARRSMVLAS